MDPRSAVAEIEERLRRAGTPERAGQEHRYLRSEITHLGASVPAIRKAARSLAGDLGTPARGEVLALVDALWGRSIHELRMAAVELLKVWVDVLDPDDVALVERLARKARTWAIVDGLAVDVAGPLLDRHPDPVAVLDRWAADEDLWVRRTALLSHLRAVRAGDDAALSRFTGYADGLLEESEFFTRKAIGWVLREAGKRDAATVVTWLAPRIDRVSGVTVREAVRHLPADDREALLAAYRGR
jgi:3-methyladenine DNA glycosylase AlkD